MPYRCRRRHRGTPQESHPISFLLVVWREITRKVIHLGGPHRCAFIDGLLRFVTLRPKGRGEKGSIMLSNSKTVCIHSFAFRIFFDFTNVYFVRPCALFLSAGQISKTAGGAEVGLRFG
ncbi:unnamed protein product, partial [Ectocarpus sp. 4 AP-2014]